MSSPQQNITIAAPGFAGINTEISPTEQAPQFAAIADNCVIDRYGRLGSRKGFRTLTTTVPPSIGFDDINLSTIHAHLDVLGFETVLSAGDNRIFKGDITITDETPVGATITNDHWQMLSFNDDCYMLQVDHTPIVYDASADTITEQAGIPAGSCGLAAFGRLWVAGVRNADNIIHWSALLDGDNFTTGDTGTINVEEYWPSGYDTITGLVAHNGRLIVFGKQNTLVFANADGDPAGEGGLTLEDTIANIGCIARDTIESTGSDVLFLDYTGVRSLSRTVTQNSLPIGEVSANVQKSIQESIVQEAVKGELGARYSAVEGFYLLVFKTSMTVYCFDTRQVGQAGDMRATTWPSSGTVSSAIRPSDGAMLLGGVGAVGLYDGYLDAGLPYKMRYFTNPLSFGDSTKLKFPKQVDLTLLAGTSGTANVLWAFDYGSTYRSRTISLTGVGEIAEFNVSEYGLSEYTAGIQLSRKKANVGGSGVVVQIGVELDIEGAAFSLQEINIQTLIGRMV